MNKVSEYARGCARLAIGFSFLASGILHATRPYFFAHAIQRYQLTDFEQTGFLANTIPLALLTIGMFLLLKVWERSMYVCCSVVLGAFTITGIFALSNHLSISCGCWGDYSPELSITHVCITGLCSGLCLFFSSTVRVSQ